MKAILKFIIISLFTLGNCVFSQEDIKDDKFSIHAFSIVPIGGELGYNYTEAGSAYSFSADISFCYKKNIFALSGAHSPNYDLFWGSSSFNSTQVNLLYGREFELLDWLSIDPYAGIGFIRFSGDYDTGFDYVHENVTELGIPILAKIRFKTGKIFSLGFKLQTTINPISTLYSLGLILQWQLDTKK